MWDSLGKFRTRDTIISCLIATRFQPRAVPGQVPLEGNNRQTEVINSNNNIKIATHRMITTKSPMKTLRLSTVTQVTISLVLSLNPINRDQVKNYFIFKYSLYS